MQGLSRGRGLLRYGCLNGFRRRTIRADEVLGQVEELAGRELIHVRDVGIQPAQQPVGGENLLRSDIQFGEDDPADGVTLADAVLLRRNFALSVVDGRGFGQVGCFPDREHYLLSRVNPVEILDSRIKLTDQGIGDRFIPPLVPENTGNELPFLYHVEARFVRAGALLKDEAGAVLTG